MNTRNRPGRTTTNSLGRTRPSSPFGLGTPNWALQVRPPVGYKEEVAATQNPACTIENGRLCSHPLTNQLENRRLLAHEGAIKERLTNIVPVLKRVAGLQHESDFVEQAQIIARQELGFELPSGILQDAWVSGLDMRALYGISMVRTLHSLAHQTLMDTPVQTALGTDEAVSFMLDCGYHAVDISPCSDGRLQGLVRYILRLPGRAVRSSKSYAGAMFDVDANVKRWVETELMRFREGRPVTADAGTRYLKMAVYHTSSSDPSHEGCAAHGSNENLAADKALGRLREFRQAIENSFCCGASVDILLVGVDTDTDAIKVHVPDARGDISLYRTVDNLALYRQTVNLDESQARLGIYQAIQEASAQKGWGGGDGEPHEGMRRLIATLLINNMSQIEYVCGNWAGRYPDIGHDERFISVGDGFDCFQLRNLSYFAHLHTVEEGALDLDVGVKIFKKLNVRHGLPIPLAINFRYDSRVPGCRERAVERCLRVKEALLSRYRELANQGFLMIGMSVQDKLPDSLIESVDDGETYPLRSMV